MVVTPDKVGVLARRVAAPGESLRRRSRAARRLARAGTPDAVRALAEAMASVRDEQVVSATRQALAGVRDQECIDAVCDVLRYRQSAELDRLVVDQGWIARCPPDVRARTALHVGRPEMLVDGDGLIAGSLVSIADGDQNPELRERARTALESLRHQDARDVVCTAAIEGNETALRAAVAAGFVPRDAARHAVLLFLGGCHDEYAELDFDGGLLRAVYESADASLRGRLAAVARRAGRLEWVRAVVGGHSTARLAELSDDEWETIRALLVGAQRWEELWHLAVEAAPVRAVEILQQLGASGWQPDEEAEWATYAELVRIAEQCARHPVARPLLEPAPNFKERVVSIAMSPDGRLLVAGKNHGEINLWRLPSGKPAGRIDAGIRGSANLVITPDSRMLVAASTSSETTYWHLPDGRRDRQTAGGHGYWLAISPNGRLLVTGRQGGGLTLRRLPSGTPIRELADELPLALVISPDGTLAAASFPDRDRTRLWRLPSGEHVADIDGYVSVMAITPDGSLLVGARSDGPVRLWHLPSGHIAETLALKGHYDHVPHLAITPDGSLLAGTDADGSIRLWRLPSGEPAGVVKVENLPSSAPRWRREIKSLAVTPDSRLLVSSSSRGNVRLWRLPSGEPAGVLERHRAEIYRLTMSPDGGMLAGMGVDGSVLLWLPRVLTAARTPVGRIGLAEADALRSLLGQSEVERPWIELISALVRWRHKHDIEVDAVVESPGATDVELGG